MRVPNACESALLSSDQSGSILFPTLRLLQSEPPLRSTAASFVSLNELEVERNLRRQRAGGDKVRAAERREEVIERVLVGDVDGGQVQVHLIAILVEDVV